MIYRHSLIRGGVYTPLPEDNLICNVDSGECSKYTHNYCPIEMLSAETIFLMPDHTCYSRRPLRYCSEPQYCIGLAQEILKGNFTDQVCLGYSARNGKCYCGTDPHPLCVLQKLNTSMDKPTGIVVDFDIRHLTDVEKQKLKANGFLRR